MRHRSIVSLTVTAALFLSLSGCGSDGEPAVASSGQTYPQNPRTVFGGERPATLQVPTTYDASKPAPLLVVLHGYGADGLYQTQYMRLAPLVESEGLLLISPDGTIDRSGSHFWNATDACCNFNRSKVDDVAYIRSLIADIRHDYNVDGRRIFLIGHSNGGFMAHRMACEAADEIAAIVSLAGATYADASKCTPAAPVSVLDIHGDDDGTIAYDGGFAGAQYPSALETLARWQGYDRCAASLTTDASMIDIDRTLAGNETSVQRYSGCANGTGVELWTIHGGPHIPTLARDFATRVWQWLQSHPKQ